MLNYISGGRGSYDSKQEAVFWSRGLHTISKTVIFDFNTALKFSFIYCGNNPRLRC